MLNNGTSGKEDELFAALGRVTISWAFLEAGIDFSILVIHQRLGGDTIERQHPRSLGRKIKYLRKAFERLPILGEHSALGIELMGQAKDATETRHDLIHGFVVEHQEDTPLNAKMSRILWQEYPPKLKRIDVSAKTTLEHAVAVNKLARQVLSIAASLAGKVS